jgi:hypothetical protein
MLQRMERWKRQQLLLLRARAKRLPDTLAETAILWFASVCAIVCSVCITLQQAKLIADIKAGKMVAAK